MQCQTRVFYENVRSILKEIGDNITAPNFRFLFLFGLVWLLYTKQAHYNEGCAKLKYLLSEV